MPAVFYVGFSIHGNEASGVNAALLVAYHLAAAQGPEIENALQNTVILFDPCYNPDGMQRFSSWVNSRKSKLHPLILQTPNTMKYGQEADSITIGSILTAIGLLHSTLSQKPGLQVFKNGSQMY
jgi:hypothetical protein